MNTIICKGGIMNRTLLITILFVFVADAANDSYRFMVVGDRTGGCVGGVFSEIIDEVTLYDPDFVMCVGDLIHGYTDDTLALHAQWDTLIAIVEKLPCPFYFVAGNHDILNLTDRDIYEQRTGCERYYSFDHMNSHFIVLDNTMVYWNPPQEMDEEQIAWLKSDLKKNKKADNIFIFYHVPSYLYALQRNEEDPFMALFESHNVTTVFTGHHHTYSYLSHNGIEYINVGSSGGGIENHDMGRGNFFQYLHVSVRGTEQTIAVILKDNIYPRNVLTASDLLLVQRADTEVISIDKFSATEGSKNITQRVSIKITNFGPEGLVDTVSWDYDSSCYSILPSEIPMDVGSEEAKTYLASITLYDGSSVFPLPRFQFRFTYSYANACTLTGYLPVKRVQPSARVATAPSIDGILSEEIWRMVEPIRELADFTGYPNTVVEKTELYTCHDEDNVYLGVRCFESSFDEMRTRALEHDSGTPWDDNLWFFFDPNNDRMTYYQMIVNSRGVIFDRECRVVDGESLKDLSWNGAWVARSGREDSAWTLEIMIPKRQFLSYSESEWGFNFRRLQTRLGDAAYWTLPFGHDPQNFGSLKFE